MKREFYSLKDICVVMYMLREYATIENNGNIGMFCKICLKEGDNFYSFTNGKELEKIECCENDYFSDKNERVKVIPISEDMKTYNSALPYIGGMDIKAILVGKDDNKYIDTDDIKSIEQAYNIELNVNMKKDTKYFKNKCKEQKKTGGCKR